MRIAFFSVKGWQKRFLTSRLKGHDLVFFLEPLTVNNVSKVRGFGIISVSIYSNINKKIIGMLPKLKLITTRSTGFDHIDLGTCKKRKITVCNTPFYGENTVAGHTFALILALSRNVHKSYLRVKRNDFSIEGLKGFDLKGKTIGVVGAGRIGLHVIKIAKGFGMNVLAYDVYKNSFLSEVLDFEYVPLKKLLEKSDIITLHVPYNKHTRHLINKDTIKLIKKGAVLINTSRGEIVDTNALINALDKKILSGAGLDVIEGEKLIKEEIQLLHDTKNSDIEKVLIRNHILLNKDNVVFTPHIAFYSQEAMERRLKTTVENISNFLQKNPQNIIK